jgi:hypothetical protein
VHNLAILPGALRANQDVVLLAVELDGCSIGIGGLSNERNKQFIQIKTTKLNSKLTVLVMPKLLVNWTGDDCRGRGKEAQDVDSSVLQIEKTMGKEKVGR